MQGSERERVWRRKEEAYIICHDWLLTEKMLFLKVSKRQKRKIKGERERDFEGFSIFNYTL